MISLCLLEYFIWYWRSDTFFNKAGEKRRGKSKKVLGNSFLFLVITERFFLCWVRFFLVPLLKLCGASETVLPYAVEYTRIIFFGAIFQVMNMGMNNFLRADGKTQAGDGHHARRGRTNILLDPLFIFGFDMEWQEQH
jgi:Na+-driven multidrug efflux pump